MKNFLILAIAVCCCLKSRSQEIIFRDDFSDSTAWELSTPVIVEAGSASALFEDQKLVLDAGQGFTDCTSATATLKTKVNPVNDDDLIMVKVFVDSFDIMGSYDFRINLGIKSKIVHLKIDDIYLPAIKKPIIQFHISDTVAISISTALNPDSILISDNELLNSPSHKQVIDSENSDSVNIQLEANACAADIGAETRAVVDSITITRLIENSNSEINSAGNLPVVKKFSDIYFLEFEEFTSCIIHVIDISGRSIVNHTFNGNLFDLGFLSEGIYLINVQSDKWNYTTKVNIIK
ncbi:MAG TPA: T9SS type A sorting domain-containing protein [Bacteroidales bacterium]|nr:T9SS type A sorting domain-containing protein [Bacteroidales bacterium]